MKDIFEYVDNFGKYRHVKSILQYGDKELCQNPKISVIMPVYGNPKFFVSSFNSVIHQDANFCYEVIVVDNTPHDAESTVLGLIKSYNQPYVFYYRNEENIGMSGNWNRGIELARSDLITYCHDDDMLCPNCLSKLWELHNDYPNRFIIPNHKRINEFVYFPLADNVPSRIRGRECISFDLLDIYMGNRTNGVGCLFYKKHMLDLGGYNEEYYPSMDNAFFIKYVFRYGAVYLRRPLYCYRITTTNTSNTVYPAFLENALYYCDCMDPLIKYPSFFKSMLKHAVETRLTNTISRVWGGKHSDMMKPTFSDQIVYKFFTFRHILKIVGLI